MKNLVTALMRMVPWSVRGKVKCIPGAAQLQRFLVSSALDGREFNHQVDAGPAKGITFNLRMPDDKGIWTGTYEQMFASRLADTVRPGMVAYDIGSWHGFFAGVMAAQGASVVHVFEPLPANADRIRQLIALNPGKNIALHACAVGERDTELDLIVMPETSMAKLEQSEFQAGVTSTARVRVSVRSLDSMIGSGEIAPPSLMKIDVEGAEMMVFEGARETLRRHHPRIFAEIHSSELLARCTTLLQSESYSIESLDHDPAAARNRGVFQIHAAVA